MDRLTPEFRRRLAKALTAIEDGSLADVRQIFPALGDPAPHCWAIGVTGPPGVGKSTLTDALIGGLRARGASVAVLAVDPSSPHSLGALLGDRIRMRTHQSDPHVYIRSMSARGRLGGLSAAAADAQRLLAAVGFDYVIIETVGVGQSELDVASAADVTMLVLSPGMGDSIQASKAGVMEVADIFVINKIDLDGAQRLESDIRAMLRSALASEGAWVPPILRTAANSNDTRADRVLDELQAHRDHQADTGEDLVRRRRQTVARMRAAALDLVMRTVDRFIESEKDEIAKLSHQLATQELSTTEAAEALVSRLDVGGDAAKARVSSA